MNIETLRGIADESGYSLIGVRCLHADETPAIGDEMPPSFIWDDGDPTEETIGGTCAWDARDGGCDLRSALQRASKYQICGRYALLGGNYSGNNDLIAEPFAIAIRDAVVLAVW